MKTKLTFSTILSDIRTVLAILGVIIGLVTWTNLQISTRNQEIALIKKDIEVIRMNELVHLNEAVGALKSSDKEQSAALIRIELLLNQLIENSTLL